MVGLPGGAARKKTPGRESRKGRAGADDKEGNTGTGRAFPDNLRYQQILDQEDGQIDEDDELDRSDTHHNFKDFLNQSHK